MINFLYHPLLRLLTAPLFYLSGLVMRGPLMVVIAVKDKQREMTDALRSNM